MQPIELKLKKERTKIKIEICRQEESIVELKKAITEHHVIVRQLQLELKKVNKELDLILQTQSNTPPNSNK